jgi:hypothetical protein
MSSSGEFEKDFLSRSQRRKNRDIRKRVLHSESGSGEGGSDSDSSESEQKHKSKRQKTRQQEKKRGRKNKKKPTAAQKKKLAEKEATAKSAHELENDPTLAKDEVSVYVHVHHAFKYAVCIYVCARWTVTTLLCVHLTPTGDL